jgi:Domain of unknown function (DUF4381)
MESMNADWLKQLAPAHAPPPPGWWPPAPGWWVLALLFLLLVAVLIYRYRSSPNRLRRTALRELKHLETLASDDMQLASELQNLLRRYAIAAYGREAVADLSGADWLAFVAAHGGADLAGETGLSFLGIVYGDCGQATDRTRWLKGARGFLRGR